MLGLVPGYDPWSTADEGMWFDEDAAQQAIDFFHECLTHQEGKKALQKFLLEPWQQGIVANLYGWKRADGTRRYREAFLFMPRKNGKTTMVAGIALKALFADGEYGAQVYSAAGDRDQAKLIYRQASGMVRTDDMLNKMGKVYQNAIVYEERNSSYKAISREAGAAHGQNPHCVVVDELHVQKTRDLVDTLHTGMANRRQPMIVYITTAGFDRESICYEKYDYACKVRDGLIEDASFLPVVFEAGPDDDWKKEKTWRKANPNLGVSVELDYLKRECQRAQEVPAYENTFRRLHLNQWTEQDTRAIQMDQWDKCGHDYTEDDLLGRECWVGLDLASTMDTTAAVLVFPEEDGRYRVLPYIWIPEDIAKKRERNNRQMFMAWAKQGFVHTTPGNETDYSFVRAKLQQLSQKFVIREIGFDKYNATTLAQILADQDGMPLVEVPQGILTMNEPTKRFLALIATGKLMHPRNPVLTWMASNVAVKIDAAENMKPEKAKSADKIDGIVAAIMGLGRAMLRQEQPEPSVLAW